MKRDENETAEIVGDLLTRLNPHHPGSYLWPLRLFHPFVRKPFPFFPSSSSSPAPGKNSLLPEDYRALPAFLSTVLAPNNSKMAKLYGISGDRSIVIDENIRQYRDIILSQDIRDIPSPQDTQKIQDSRISEDVKRRKSADPCKEDDLPSTMQSQYSDNFHDVQHAAGLVPDGLHRTLGPHDRDTVEGSYSVQGHLDRGSRRFGSEHYRDLNVSGTEDEPTEAPSASGNFYSASGEAFQRTVTSPSGFQVKPKTVAAGEGVAPGTPNASLSPDASDRFLASKRRSCRDGDVIENGADHLPPRFNEDRKNKIDELDQDLADDDPNTSKGADDGERKEENCESPGEETTYPCPVCAFTTTDSLVFLPHVIHHCRQPRVGGPPYNPEDRKRRLSGGHLLNQSLGGARKKGFHCKKCDFESEDKDVYYDHLASHIKIESRYSCVLCSFVTGLRHHITYHICNHFGIKSIRCNIDKCNYVCINQSMLKSHLKKHPTQVCCRCHFTTKSNSEAEKHVRETDHSVETSVRRTEEVNYQQSGILGSREAQGGLFGAHRTELASRPEQQSFGVPLPPYLSPAAAAAAAVMAGGNFLHGLVSPLLWPGALTDGRRVMNQRSSGHPFRNLGADLSPSFPQSPVSQKQWAAQFGNASDLYDQFLSFQKSFPSATVPPVTGFPPQLTRIQDSMPNAMTSLPVRFFSEASPGKTAQSSVSGEVFKSQNIPLGGQKFLPDATKCKKNTTSPLDLTKSQPFSENTNTQFSGNRPLGREQLNEAKTSCEDAVTTPSKFCRRKGVARKVVVDQGPADYAGFALDDHLRISNCENVGRASSDGRRRSNNNGRPLSNSRPSSEGCVSSLVYDLWPARPSQTGTQMSPDEESGGGDGGGSALRDLISASESLLPPITSNPLRIDDRLIRTRSGIDRSPVSKDSSTKGESEISRSAAGKGLLGAYDCGHCGIRFQDYVLYSMHSGYHNFNDPLQCNFCGRKYDNFYEFYEHIGKVEHPE